MGFILCLSGRKGWLKINKVRSLDTIHYISKDREADEINHSLPGYPTIKNYQ